MEVWDLSTPLDDTVWQVPDGTEMTLTFMAFVPQGDVGTIVVQPGGKLKLAYQDGVRTDPTVRPRTVGPGSVLSYVVIEVGDDGPLYRIALNRAGG